tara:strand:- start:1442 stop:1960 length:519 start_codon:yes stop_codon:yes gene_type:complete
MSRGKGKPKEGKQHKTVRFTKAVQDFIIKKMIDGYDILNIVKKWPDQVPAYETIVRASNKDEEWAERVNQAYGLLLMRRVDELNELASMPAREMFPEIEDWREANECKRAKIDALKFTLGKMAPVLSKRFDKAQKVEVEGGAGLPQLAVINYYADAPKAIDEGTTVEGQLDE